MAIDFKPLTPERWDDFEELFGEHGAYGGCWCMFWRVTRREFSQGCKGGNKKAMKALVESGVIPGIMAFESGQPLGWVSVAPREEYKALERSRILKRVDDQPVWSIVCFYAPKNRHGGMMESLIKGAVEYAQSMSAGIVEAYPEVIQGAARPVDLYMGNLDTFLKAGFMEVERRGSQAIVRKHWGNKQKAIY